MSATRSGSSICLRGSEYLRSLHVSNPLVRVPWLPVGSVPCVSASPSLTPLPPPRMLQEQSCLVLPDSLLEVSDLYTMCGYWLTVHLPRVWHLLGKSWCSQYRGALGYILWDPFALLSLSCLLCSSFPSARLSQPLAFGPIAFFPEGSCCTSVHLDLPHGFLHVQVWTPRLITQLLSPSP